MSARSEGLQAKFVDIFDTARSECDGLDVQLLKDASGQLMVGEASDSANPHVELALVA
jgi:hypothetical protein